MEQLGRYLLDRKLASGGMAEVFLAKQVGPGGYEKACVVKRMLPHLSEDMTFVEMFLDEARLAARLAHPGIAQIFDFGHERDSYYLAMEYVPGANLKMVLDANLEHRRQVPLTVAARLVSLVAAALDYAHHAADEKGTPLDLIHRDVSPQNIMVSVSGDVKLIDFGIAKASTDSHRTVAGTLKGKYAYMSPEQLRQQTVDQRTDIYALGLVFYELITGHPAVASNDNANALMVAAAQRRYAPIESARPETPRRLRLVLDRALALNPVDRFQTAREMADQLEDWLTSTGTRVKPSELAALVVDAAVMTTDPVGNVTITSSPPVKKRASAAEPMTEPVPQVSEARTLQDVPAPVGLTPIETVALRRIVTDSDRTPLMTPGVERQDLSMQPTPMEGTPPVARRAHVPDQSLMPTEPERPKPDIEAAMARPPKTGKSGKSFPSISEATPTPPLAEGDDLPTAMSKPPSRELSKPGTPRSPVPAASMGASPAPTAPSRPPSSRPEPALSAGKPSRPPAAVTAAEVPSATVVRANTNSRSPALDVTVLRPGPTGTANPVAETPDTLPTEGVAVTVAERPSGSKSRAVDITPTTTPKPSDTHELPDAPQPKRGRKWPLVLLMLMLLPIGAVAAAIEFLPAESPIRQKVLERVAPLLEKLERVRK